MFRGVFRTKNVSDILATADQTPHGLRRSLGPLHVTLLGIGGIIGAGIFALVGTAAAGDAARPGAGPSIMLSFVITAVACGFTALCYAEFASMVPVSGSAYTYAYASLGELIAWIIGWDLILEYAVGNTSVAISWAGYFRALLESSMGLHLPSWLSMDYRTAIKEGFVDQLPHIAGIPIAFNLPAFSIVALLTVILVWGIRESAAFNAWMVIIKIIVLAFFVGVACYYVSPSEMSQHWRPFQPNGWTGTLTGAAIVFFAYIGFDAVSTVAEETKNPKRDIPIGIIASLIICTIIYIIVAAVFTGIIPFGELRTRSPSELSEALTMALNYVAPDQRWATAIVAFGSVVAHTAVLLVFQMGQPRIFFSMARDGLLPSTFARVHPRFHTPHIPTILTGIVVGLVSAVANIEEMVDLTNIGTLFAFFLVCIGVPILRYTNPEHPRPFRVPFGPFIMPLLGAASCIFLMFYLPPASWWRFIGWLVLGLSIYAFYGYSHSHLGRQAGRVSASMPLRAAGLGFLLTAVGLFTIPHNANLSRLWSAATTAGAAHHLRAAIGMGLIAVGVLIGMIGALSVNSKTAAR